MRLGLALSGGGLRATLFHLGVVKALQRFDALKDVRHITSVSGGSILAAHLVKNWSLYLDENKFADAAQQLVNFARMDVRGSIFRRVVLLPYLALPYIHNLRHMPPRFRREGTVRNLLFQRYLEKLLGKGSLDELAAAHPEAPQLDILTTNLNRGSLAYFTNKSFVPSDGEGTPIETRTPVARAVMMSALFPAVFPTQELTRETLGIPDAQIFPQAEYFTDGGVYDNLGIRRFQTLLKAEIPPVDNVLVCDASGAFNWLVERETLWLWQTALRSAEIFMKRLADLECEVAGAAPDRFMFIRISDTVEPSGPHELSKYVQQQVKNVRTDLDQFTTVEMDAIVQHGYSVASRKLEHLLGRPAADQTPWQLFPKKKRPSEAQFVQLLRSARFHSNGLLRWGDWASYVYPAICLVLLLMGWRWYDAGRFDRYYDALPTSERDIAISLRDPEGAIREIEAAMAYSAAKPETCLRMTMLAYSLWIQRKAPHELFARALQRLEKHERTLFEEAKWHHYFGTLEKNTFGVPTIKELRKAITFINDAIPFVAPDAQAEAALTSYGGFLTVRDDENAKDAAKKTLELLKRILDQLDMPGVEKRLTDLNRFRTRLLKGHYLLESGNLSTSKRDAEEHYREAAKRYAEARTVGFLADYWKVEFNTCNALFAAAGAVEDHRDASRFLTSEDRAGLDSVIAKTLNQALDGCRQAHELAPASWQPLYGIGSILLKKGDIDGAAASFLLAYRNAEIARAQDSLVDYLLIDRNFAQPLCRNPNFSRTFVRICRR